MDPVSEYQLKLTRRTLLANVAKGMGGAALATLISPESLIGASGSVLDVPHFAPKAKRVIYLFCSGGPSSIDMYDYKPTLPKIHGTELPASIRRGQRITGMTSGQKSFPCVAPMFKFKKYGQHGTWVSELLPHTSAIVDDISIIKTVNTEAINHDPAITYINTGVQQPGKPSMGAWLSYGLGSPNKNLPAYIVMISKGRGQSQALYTRLWGSGFLSSQHQGVQFRSGAEPVLYLKNPQGIDSVTRRRMLDGIAKINAEEFNELGDPETQARIAQYEMAFRMQSSVPDLVDLTREPQSTFDLYGETAKKPGTFAANCVIARRMAERGVPFVQLFHRGWDQHGSLPELLRYQCEDIDQPSAALMRDLKQRGMLDETLVVCGGEFGRTIYSQGALSKDDHGRDHHGRCFTTWMAGGGIKAGYEHGETDDYCYNIVRDGVHIRDMNATILNQLGINHERLTYRFQGLDQRLTGFEPTRVVTELIA